MVLSARQNLFPKTDNFNARTRFKNYLLQNQFAKVTVKNYLSDLNHFLAWLELTLRGYQQPLFENEERQIMAYFEEEFLAKYKKFLLDNHFPLSTTNRRLSTLRTFGDFCVGEKILAENPARLINNLPLKASTNDEIGSEVQKEAVLVKFKNYLVNEKNTSNTIKNYLSDIREFLSWVDLIGT